MIKQIEITRKNEQKTSTWSGGKTTEITIFPKESSYLNRDFLFRISSATVEIEESDFTELENTHRILMILDGNLKLIHPNKYEKSLGYLEKDKFEGDWKTKSIGKCRDFNLMVKKDSDFDMKSIIISSNESKEIKLENINNKTNHYLLFVYKGSCNINTENENTSLQSEDLIHLIFDDKEDSTIKIENDGLEETTIILNHIKY